MAGEPRMGCAVPGVDFCSCVAGSEVQHLRSSSGRSALEVVLVVLHNEDHEHPPKRVLPEIAAVIPRWRCECGVQDQTESTNQGDGHRALLFGASLRTEVEYQVPRGCMPPICTPHSPGYRLSRQTKPSTNCWRTTCIPFDITNIKINLSYLCLFQN